MNITVMDERNRAYFAHHDGERIAYTDTVVDDAGLEWSPQVLPEYEGAPVPVVGVPRVDYLAQAPLLEADGEKGEGDAVQHLRLNELRDAINQILFPYLTTITPYARMASWILWVLVQVHSEIGERMPYSEYREKYLRYYSVLAAADMIYAMSSVSEHRGPIGVELSRRSSSPSPRRPLTEPSSAWTGPLAAAASGTWGTTPRDKPPRRPLMTIGEQETL